MFVCESVVLSGTDLCDVLITRPEESYRLWCVVVCDLETSEWGGPGTLGGLSHQKQNNVARDNSVGTTTRCGLDAPGIESRLGVTFSAPVQTGPGAHPAFYTRGTGSFLGVKRPGRGVDHPPHPAPRLKKEYSYTSTPPLSLRGLF